MTYPRSRNGHVDTGEPIKAANRGRSCPNCGSHSYRETLSREHCSACGLEMDYWGNGGNAVYERYQAREYAREEAADQARHRQEELDYWSYPHDD